MYEYNLMGEPEAIRLVVEKFCLKVTESFSPGDINVVIPDADSDEVNEYCDSHNIECKMI